MAALICGVGKEDGAYLFRHLFDEGYEVIGATRDAVAPSFGNLKSLGIRERVINASIAITCRIPDDCIDSRRYPLFMGRAVMQELIKGLKTQAKAQPKRKTARGSPS